MTALADRIRTCAEKVGGGDALARKTGIPRSTLETYLTGKAEPKASRIAEICEAAAVSADWLVSGKQPSSHAAPGVTAGIQTQDLQTLILIVQRLEEMIADRGLEVTVEKRGELALLLFEYVRETGKLEPERVERYLRLVA
ncbi:helix-turn-helix domain-containing protein [Cupriavidus pauculus]|uniref:helix-turn-helix domain-containing protein n=1 Tax=Cupriavidus pauculus TaxID=82633 RepID=UPI003857262B